jgi:hypothetical protein
MDAKVRTETQGTEFETLTVAEGSVLMAEG